MCPNSAIIGMTAQNVTQKIASYMPSSFELLDKLWTSYGPVLMISLALLWMVQALHHKFFHSLSKVPGPGLASVSELWRTIRYFRGTWHDDIISLHQKYGKVVRIAPDEVSFVDAAALKGLYGMGKTSLKSKWYDTWTIPNMTVSFFAATEPKLHRHLRSRVSNAYSMSSILSMEPFIQEVASELWGRFREFSKSSERVPLHLWGNYFAFEVVGQLSLGGKIGFVERGEDVDGIIKSIHDGFYLMANMGNVPLQMFWFNNRIAQWIVRTCGGKRLNSFNVFLQWLEKRVIERMENGLGDKRKDMLQHFVEAKDVNGQPVKKGDVMIEGVNILGAGADTTSISILAVMGAILTHPEAKRQLQEELDQAYKDLGLEGTDSEIDFKDAEKLPYLGAVIKESMRLHPSINYQLPRIVPAPGIQIGDYFIKSGSICSISATTMNRSKEIFGADAEEWKPERWIPATEEDQCRVSTMNGFLTTFGMGARSCVGRNIALVEVHKFIAQFFRHFDPEVVNKEKPWVVRSQWFAIQKEFWVTIKEREHKA
ncbi:hypothetical protein PENCOP_c006G00339 [Penicillium coprophilum]|uniref:Uncharacterized protein n=1 Tax=Penicillium coprophilum TaxID=36646 RepID=A0A1V6UNR8_9EURO|nr:hypothetical protein PENCOP_c006G00339 [Penicillium coprophilum]